MTQRCAGGDIHLDYPSRSWMESESLQRNTEEDLTQVEVIQVEAGRGVIRPQVQELL